VLRLNGNLKMSNCLIEGSLGYGLTTSASSTFSLFANNVIKSCDQTPIKLGNFRQAGSFDSTSSLTGNSNEYILISSGYVDENVTVKPASVPYFCDSWVVIRNQRVLNINAGAKFYMNSDAYLEVTDGATIKMLGNSSNRIQFMGSPNSSGKGAWKYISVGTNNDNRMEYVDFINGGKETSYGVIRLSGTLSMNNCKISGSKANGFYTSSAATLTEFNGNVIDGCNACPVWLSNISQTSAIDSSSTLTGNTDDYIGIGAGYCDVASEMKGTSVPYMLDNWIVLRKGRFTIGAGATVYLKESAYMQTTDQGILDIQGTASSPVKFTRLPGTAYYWKNIEIGESNGSKIENCTFEYGGNSYGLLDVSSNRTLTLKDCTFKDSKNYGVYMSSGSTVSHSGTINFSNCASGNVRLPNGTVSTTLP
jgi:hypothetical protein